MYQTSIQTFETNTVGLKKLNVFGIQMVDGIKFVIWTDHNQNKKRNTLSGTTSLLRGVPKKGFEVVFLISLHKKYIISWLTRQTI